MRSLILTAAILALPMTAPAVARAATVDLSGEFQAICVANRTDMSRAINTARARGYTVMDVPAPEGVKSMTALTRDVDGQRWAVVVGLGGSPASGLNPAQDFAACSVSGFDVGTAGADAVRRWAGVTANQATDSQTSYFFREEGGRHTALNAADNAAMIAAVKAGGFYLLQIDTKDVATAVTLTRSVPAN